MRKLFAVLAVAALLAAGCNTKLKPGPGPTEKPIVYEKSLTAAQERAFDETWDAVQKFITKGDIKNALAAVAVLNGPGGPAGCEAAFGGSKYQPGDGGESRLLADNTVGATIQTLSETGAAKIVTADVAFPPLVETAYRGTYPNGKPYLKVTEQRALIFMAMRCAVNASPNPNPGKPAPQPGK